MNKTAKHFKTRETNQNQSLSEEWEWDNHFPNVSVFKPSAHLSTSGRPKRWQWANTRQALPQSLWELLHLNTQRTSIIFNYFLFTMICKYGMIIMPHHRKAAKTKGPFGTFWSALLRENLFVTLAALHHGLTGLFGPLALDDVEPAGIHNHQHRTHPAPSKLGNLGPSLTFDATTWNWKIDTSDF